MKQELRSVSGLSDGSGGATERGGELGGLGVSEGEESL